MLLGIVFYMMLDGSRSALWCGSEGERSSITPSEKVFITLCSVSLMHSFSKVVSDLFCCSYGNIWAK